MAGCSQSMIVKAWKKIVGTVVHVYSHSKNIYFIYSGAIFIIVPSILTTGSIHSVLKLDSRHFGVVAASDYKSLGIDSLLVQ